MARVVGRLREGVGFDLTSLLEGSSTIFVACLAMCKTPCRFTMVYFFCRTDTAGKPM